MKNEKDEQPI